MKKSLTTDFNRSVTVETEEGQVYLTVEDVHTGDAVHARIDLAETLVLRDYLTEALEPQKFYLKLFDSTYGYVNKLRNMECATGKYMSSIDSEGTSSWQTQFTQAEIDSDPELKKFEAFKVPVEDAE